MPNYEIWGQNDEENVAHGDSYSVNETLGVEAKSPEEAIQVMVTDSLESGEPLPPPANGDHWHFKVVESGSPGDTHEYAVRLQWLPALKIGEMEPKPTGEDGAI